MNKSEGNEDNNQQNNWTTPEKLRSFWIDTAPESEYFPLEDGVEVDVAVIGSGIVGITAAAFLKEAGLTVALVDMGRIGKNVTGHTTAKITSLHGPIYHRLLNNFSTREVQMYAEANQSAIDKVEAIVNAKGIDCDFSRTPAYVYTELRKNLHTIKAEAKAAKKAGLPVYYVEESPLPFKIMGAVRLENQARFHPLTYLLTLAFDIPGDGSHIYENTRALRVYEDAPCVVDTDRGRIKARDVVIATHFPFYDKGWFFARAFPYHTYALGVRVEGEPPEGMFYTEDGAHYAIRSQPTEKGPLLVISGGYHKVGKGGDIVAQYKDLERRTRERFDVKSVDYYWSTEDYDSADGMPYIGLSPGSEHVYVATGFGGWGMTNGTLSAMIIADLILGRSNPWSSLFDPSRVRPIASGRQIIGENVNAVKEFVSGLVLAPKERDIAVLPVGEGMKMVIDKKEVAVYRDEDGTVHAVSPVCTHMACTVNWNNAEKTWDCPCHGSRYTYDGKVIHGPAVRNLRKRSLY